ncbi:MAG: thioredoxin family protein [Thermoguttaceae bacterium]
MPILVVLVALGQLPTAGHHAGTAWPSFQENLPPPAVISPQPGDPPPSPGGSDVLLLVFTSAWCGPCARVRPALDALEAEGVAVRRIDYDAEPALAATHRVTTLPTMIVLHQGVEIGRRVGVVPVEELRAFVRSATAQPGRSGSAGSRAPSPAPMARPRSGPFRLFVRERRR